MEVLRETPIKLVGKKQWAETPQTSGRKPLSSVMASRSHNNKRPPAGEVLSSSKRMRQEEEPPIKPRDIEARIRMLFPKDDVIDKVSIVTVDRRKQDATCFHSLLPDLGLTFLIPAMYVCPTICMFHTHLRKRVE